jgi:hypothetical protein
MNPKNLMSLTVKRVNRLTKQDLPIDFVELSEIDLQHIVGGSIEMDSDHLTPPTTTTTTTHNADGSTTVTTTTTYPDGRIIISTTTIC